MNAASQQNQDAERGTTMKPSFASVAKALRSIGTSEPDISAALHGINEKWVWSEDDFKERRQARRERLANLSLSELWDLWERDEEGAVRPSDLIPILEAALGDDAPDDIERFGMDAWDYVDQLFEDLADLAKV
jgi:hypothetical protein